MQYLRERRKNLGGALPLRRTESTALKTPSDEIFEEFYKGTEGKLASTTMAYGRILSKLLRDETIGKLIVPIIPDEARTFSMRRTFSANAGFIPMWASCMNLSMLTPLCIIKEAKDGQILEEGINEAGAISSFIAAGTAYRFPTISAPFPSTPIIPCLGPNASGIWSGLPAICVAADF